MMEEILFNREFGELGELDEGGGRLAPPVL